MKEKFYNFDITVRISSKDLKRDVITNDMISFTPAFGNCIRVQSHGKIGKARLKVIGVGWSDSTQDQFGLKTKVGSGINNK